MIRPQTALIVIASTLVGLLALPADANRFYKCKDADGNTVLSQFPCAEAADSKATAVAEGNAAYARSASTSTAPPPSEGTESAPDKAPVEPVSEPATSDQSKPAGTDSDAEVIELSEEQLRATRRATPAMQRAAGASPP